MQTFQPSTPLDPTFRNAVATEISSFLNEQAAHYQHLGDHVPDLFSMAHDFTAGGKRVRPAFCYWSYIAASEGEPDAALLTAAASLDLLHVSALMHDDVMDASDTRRGVAAAHRQYETRHRRLHGSGDAESFGRAGAILLGDLLLTLSVEMFDQAGLRPEAHSKGSVYLQVMRTEVVLGQFLDLTLQALPPESVDDRLSQAVQVTEYKTARYSVRRPCQVGGALAGADPRLNQALAAFGSPLGRAFQLRDDLLGIFGDPEVTGKPAGDDLREGKHTVLVALAMTHGSPTAKDQLAKMLGNPELVEKDIDMARQIMVDSGALRLAEDRIKQEYHSALEALTNAHLTEPGQIALREMARLCVERDY